MTHPSPTTRPSSSTRVHAGSVLLFPACVPQPLVFAPRLPWPSGDALHSPTFTRATRRFPHSAN